MVWHTFDGVRSGSDWRKHRHDEKVLDIAFSPDTFKFATASADGTAGIWSATRGELILTLRHGARIHSVNFSSDGCHVLTGGSDGYVRIWNSESGRPEEVIQASGTVLSISLQEGEKFLAVGAANHGSTLWLRREAGGVCR